MATFARHNDNDDDDDNRIFARSFEDGPRRHFRRARSKFFRSKASQNSLVSGDDDAKLARLTAQFRGRDDVKKKEQDDKRKERSETRVARKARNKRAKEERREGYIGRNIYEESSTPTRKSLLVAILRVSQLRMYMYTYVRYIVCVTIA